MMIEDLALQTMVGETRLPPVTYHADSITFYSTSCRNYQTLLGFLNRLQWDFLGHILEFDGRFFTRGKPIRDDDSAAE